MITIEQIKRIMPLAKRAEMYLPTLNKYAEKFGVNTPLRMAHFLAQIATESGEMNYTVENLNYTAQSLLKVFPRYFKNSIIANAYAHNPERIANRVYSNRLGNGDANSGDGYRYRGRGFIQITGKANYADYARECCPQALNHPELLEGNVEAMRSALWWWYKHGCNEIADTDNVTALRKRINGGLNGIEKATKYTKIAKMVLIE